MTPKEKTSPVTLRATMGPGEPPPAVRLSVTQGPHTLQTADVDPADPAATFHVEPGDYVAQAVALVPQGAPVTRVFAAPVAITVTGD